ncbi:MAG: hypothetical protein NC120_09595 [Ruminococcus sp.]|nr:hypothetical protein [Ruminococcus sp.]
MNDFESVSILTEKTGATFEEAKNAFEACGKDMLEAAVMLEKNKKAHAPAASCGAKYSGKFKNGARAAAESAGRFFNKLCVNTLKITGKKEYFSMPLIAAALLLLCLWEIVFPAAVISLLCGVCYTVCGPDFKNSVTLGITRPDSAGESGDNGFFGK